MMRGDPKSPTRDRLVPMSATVTVKIQSESTPYE
jgi:hypothetical protein